MQEYGREGGVVPDKCCNRTQSAMSTRSNVKLSAPCFCLDTPQHAGIAQLREKDLLRNVEVPAWQACCAVPVRGNLLGPLLVTPRDSDSVYLHCEPGHCIFSKRMERGIKKRDRNGPATKIERLVSAAGRSAGLWGVVRTDRTMTTSLRQLQTRRRPVPMN